VAPATGQRAPRRRGSELERAILDAAASLLAEGGYASFTTDALASRARVSKATIYRRWRSKLELVTELLDERLELIEVGDHGSFELELRETLERRLLAWEQPGTTSLFASVLGAAAVDQGLGEALRERAGKQLDAHERLVRRGVERGDIAPVVDPRTIALLISGPSILQLMLLGGEIDRSFVEQQIAVVLAAAR
jgi:AcrR family transcriptional regulator